MRLTENKDMARAMEDRNAVEMMFNGTFPTGRRGKYIFTVRSKFYGVHTKDVVEQIYKLQMGVHTIRGMALFINRANSCYSKLNALETFIFTVDAIDRDDDNIVIQISTDAYPDYECAQYDAEVVSGTRFDIDVVKTNADFIYVNMYEIYETD